jgi:hypothetical protein
VAHADTHAVRIAGLTPDERETYDERAAIMEFDGGLSRADADRHALVVVLRHRQEQVCRTEPRREP